MFHLRSRLFYAQAKAQQRSLVLTRISAEWGELKNERKCRVHIYIKTNGVVADRRHQAFRTPFPRQTHVLEGKGGRTMVLGADVEKQSRISKTSDAL